jgi:hypothetical protein
LRFESEPPQGAKADDDKLPAESFWVHACEVTQRTRQRPAPLILTS